VSYRVLPNQSALLFHFLHPFTVADVAGEGPERKFDRVRVRAVLNTLHGYHLAAKVGRQPTPPTSNARSRQLWRVADPWALRGLLTGEVQGTLDLLQNASKVAQENGLMVAGKVTIRGTAFLHGRWGLENAPRYLTIPGNHSTITKKAAKVLAGNDAAIIRGALEPPERLLSRRVP